MKKAFIVAAVILIAVGLSLFAGAFIYSKFDFSLLDIARTEENTYAVGENFKRIEIHSQETDIVFKPSSDGQSSVVCLEREKVKHSVTVENNTLKINADNQREWYDYINFFTKSLSMTVYLPLNEYDSLLVDNSTGDISIPKSFSFGSIDISTSTGNIGLDGISASRLNLSVSTGNINANSIACEGDISVAVSTGRVNLTDVTCKNIVSQGSTGDITLKNVIASEKISIKRSTGDVKFENSDSEQINVKTSTGDVTGTLLSEKVFITETSTGDISVPNTVSGGKCEITTSTGDILIQLASVQ